MGPYELAEALPETFPVRLGVYSVQIKKNYLDEHIQLYIANTHEACFSLIVSPGDKSVHLMLLEAIPTCFTPRFEGRGAGTLLLKFAIIFSRKLQAESITLCDTAIFEHLGLGLDLGLLSLLTQGHTWYNRYDFVPQDPAKHTLYKHHQSIVRDSTVGSLPLEQREALIRELGVSLDTPLMLAMRQIFEKDPSLYEKLSLEIARHFALLYDVQGYARQFNTWILKL
jgi:hypothetical protein